MFNKLPFFKVLKEASWDPIWFVLEGIPTSISSTRLQIRPLNYYIKHKNKSVQRDIYIYIYIYIREEC